MTDTRAERLRLAGFGAGAGVAGWLLTDVLVPVLGRGALHLAVTVFAAVFFTTALALAGTVRTRAALGFAALNAAVATALTALALPRFDSVDDLAASAGFLPALTLIAALPIPFRLAAAQGSWRDPAAVFEAGWSLTLRTLAALLFAALVWLVLWLCDALLGLVGIDLLDTIFDAFDPLPWVVTGAVLGLGLAVMAEAVEQIPLALVARLLRLILPPLTLVVALFLALVPIRGIGAVFQDLSAGGVILAIAFGAIGLLTLVAGSRETAAPGPVERLSARGLALLLLPLAGLAGWAVLARVTDYGLTPDRIMACLLTLTVAGFAIGYAVSALFGGRGWLAHVARASLWMGAAIYALAALSLTPLGDPFRLSTASQIARFSDGRLPPANLPLVEMRFDWGRAGARGLAALRDRADADLTARLDRLDTADSRYAAQETVPRPGLEALTAQLVIRPAGRPLPEGLDLTPQPFELSFWERACAHRDPQSRPGCVLVLGDFRPEVPGDEAMLFLWDGRLLQRFDYAGGKRDGQMEYQAHDLDGAATLAALHDGRFAIGPARTNALQIGPMDLMMNR